MAKKSKKEEYFAKHPLAMRIMNTVENWAKAGYPIVENNEISPITRELLGYWFNEDIHEQICFHICQRRAIEAIIYCYEILGIPLPINLFEKFDEEELDHEGLKMELGKIDFPRFAIKMATGTGKTWVINALIVWQYFNKIKTNSIKFSTHFLVLAPGNIVYDRLLDSFQGKIENGKRNKTTADLSKELFIPPAWRSEFRINIYTKNDITGNTQSTDLPSLMITNWHQLVDSSKKDKRLAEDIGLEFQDDNESYRVQNFYDFLSANKDLVIINDEAHHLHNASDKDQKRWQDALERLHSLIKTDKSNLFVQFDFTATPYTIKGKKEGVDETRNI